MRRRNSPGCPCCDEDEPCGEICITVTNEDGLGLIGATVDGGALGTCTTDADGVCCLEITSTGTYSFTISKYQYTTQSLDVVIGEEDCDATTPVTTGTVLLPEGEPDTGAVSGCSPFFLGGVEITITDDLGNVVATAFSDANGHASFTLPAPFPRSFHFRATKGVLGQPWGVSEFDETFFSEGPHEVGVLMSFDADDWICCGGDTPTSRTLHITTPHGAFTFAKHFGDTGSWGICYLTSVDPPAAAAYSFQCWEEEGVPGYLVHQHFCAQRPDAEGEWSSVPGVDCDTAADGSTHLTTCLLGENAQSASHSIFVPRTPQTMSPVAVSVVFPATTDQNFLDGAFRTLDIPFPGTVTITE